jgi:hypothetical protein
MSIPVPYHVIGTQRIFNLLRAARTLYIDKLIQDVENRAAMARDARVQHQNAINLWNSYSEEQKTAECRRIPEFEIRFRYDFRLGISVRLARPEKVARREYEDQVRARIVAGATEFERKFNDLRDKLVKMSSPGGRADYLVMKLLIDSALRGSHLPLSAAQFQTDYIRWAEITGPALWAHIAAWCARHDYPLADLAQDNVVFNVRVNWQQSTIAVEPWVVIDLHNYEIEVDPTQCRMRVRCGPRRVSLEDMTVSNRSLNVNGARELHQHFEAWLKRFPYPLNIGTDCHGVLPPTFPLGEHRVPILFTLAKGLLLAGEWERAQNNIGNPQRGRTRYLFSWRNDLHCRNPVVATAPRIRRYRSHR